MSGPTHTRHSDGTVTGVPRDSLSYDALFSLVMICRDIEREKNIVLGAHIAGSAVRLPEGSARAVIDYRDPDGMVWMAATWIDRDGKYEPLSRFTMGEDKTGPRRSQGSFGLPQAWT